MALVIAAIRSGTAPCAPLPRGTFHRWLEESIVCQKCDLEFKLVVDYDESVDRWFEFRSKPLLDQLRRAVLLDHFHNHLVTHFETAGVVVKSHTGPPRPPPASKLP